MHYYIFYSKFNHIRIYSILIENCNALPATLFWKFFHFLFFLASFIYTYGRKYEFIIVKPIFTWFILRTAREHQQQLAYLQYVFSVVSFLNMNLSKKIIINFTQAPWFSSSSIIVRWTKKSEILFRTLREYQSLKSLNTYSQKTVIHVSFSVSMDRECKHFKTAWILSSQ